MMIIKSVSRTLIALPLVIVMSAPARALPGVVGFDLFTEFYDVAAARRERQRLRRTATRTGIGRRHSQRSRKNRVRLASVRPSRLTSHRRHAEKTRRAERRGRRLFNSPSRRKPNRRRVRLAALGSSYSGRSFAKPRIVRRGHVRVSCFPSRLNALLRQVQDHYGRRVHVTSGYRSHRHNRRVGGARRSYHLKCLAADIKVPGVGKYRLARYLKKLPGRGGVGTYACNGAVHIDVGPRRAWHWRCGRKKLRKNKIARQRARRRAHRRS
ncbi:hypothetical protein MnTg02_00638 [bacterium MnTg02]|nr:hypothetical protein MnTg02_00638 [bacterium MnTg02]